MNDQIKDIRKILKSTKNIDFNTCHYSVDEKCNSIYNWNRNNDVEFDLSFVESIHDYYLSKGKCSYKQTASLDNIIEKFKIDVGRWLV